MERKEKEQPKRKEKKPLHVIDPIVAAANTIMREQCLNGVPSDVNGSYTGTPADGGVPEQDPDDL